MAELPLTGGCLCGRVRFELWEEPVLAGYCHCTRCQRRTGTAASISARFPPGALKVISGQELLDAFRPEDGSAKVFCSACGGALWAEHRSDPSVVSIRFGAFDGDPGIRPSYRHYVAYAAPWEPIPDDGLSRYDEAHPPLPKQT